MGAKEMTRQITNIRQPEKLMADKVRKTTLLAVPDDEKIRRYDAMVKATFCHLNGEDLLQRMHPRRTIDIKRRVDSVETWFEGNWLSTVMSARDGRK